MNKLIIDQFHQLLKQIEAEKLNAQIEGNSKELLGHQFRYSAIKKALSVLRDIGFKIKEADDLKDIPGIGKGILKRIDEIIKTGELSELKNKYDKKKQSKIDSIIELENVIGIGSAIAKKLVTKHNIKSIDELKKAIKKKKITVSKSIELGLKYYGIVDTVIPRKEITATEKYLIKKAHAIDPELEIMICGSYRRGKKTSGDIDLILYHPKIKTKSQVLYPKKHHVPAYLDLFIEELEEDNFLIDTISFKNMKYMGFSQYKKYPVRRIDIRYFAYESLPSAMLYFTGPYELNTHMRKEAKKRHLLLNEYGLYKDKPGEELKKIKVKSEKEIFEILGMKYLTPVEREKYSELVNKRKIK